MTQETGHASQFLINGFHTVIGLWVWGLVVALYATWRSVFASDPDSIRPSGPTGA